MGLNLIDNMFVFGEKSTKDFNVILSGYEAYNMPTRDVSVITVPGRDGVLTMDNNRFNNVSISYKCLIYKDIGQYFEAFRSYMATMTGYKRLEDSFHPEEFRTACVTEEIVPSMKGKYEAVSFEVTFSCKPQRWLKSGEETITLTNSGKVINNTLFMAKPLLRVYANGTLTFNNKTMTVSNVNGYTDIDCDMMFAYKGSTNKNSSISGTFPTLIPGENNIAFTGGRIDITPRWYTI